MLRMASTLAFKNSRLLPELGDMLARRIIPCLDVHAGHVTRGVQFGKAEAGELRNVGDPVELAVRYKLGLAHFQSHYLPKGWEPRTQSIGRFGQLDVFATDVYDVLLSKLFSKRTKDRDDLRALKNEINPQLFADRMKSDCQSFLADPEGDPLGMRIVSAEHGSARLSGDGSQVLFRPDPGFAGAAGFTVVADDGYSQSAASTVGVTVSGDCRRKSRRLSGASRTASP